MTSTQGKLTKEMFKRIRLHTVLKEAEEEGNTLLINETNKRIKNSNIVISYLVSQARADNLNPNKTIYHQKCCRFHE